MSLLEHLFRQLPQVTRETDLLAALKSLVNAPEWEETQLVVEQHPELLTELASSLLSQLTASARDQGADLAAQAFEEHGRLLQRCREVGVEQAVAEWSGPTGSPEWPLPDPALVEIPPELRLAVAQGLQAEQLFGITADLGDLALAADAWRVVLQGLPAAMPPDPFRLATWQAAGKTLLRHGILTRQPADLTLAIEVWRLAAKHAPDGSIDQSTSLGYLGRALFARYTLSGQQCDLDDAIVAFRRAIEATPKRTPAQKANLAAALAARSGRADGVDDLDEAIELYRQALAGLSTLSTLLPATLSSLGESLRRRYDRSAALDDLSEAIALDRRAIQATSPGAPELAERLARLALALRARYDATAQLSDLEEAIHVLQQALIASPASSAGLPAIAEALAGSMQELYGLTGLFD